MKAEVELCANHSHGTKEINKANNHIEWSIRIPWNKKDKVYQRWQKYKQDIDIVKLNTKEEVSK
jgi:ATP-dependent Lon protease